MADFCPECGEKRDIQRIEREVEITVRGEIFTVLEVIHRCTACGEEFTSSVDCSDPVAAAFALYRNYHGMVSPSQIKVFRKKYRLTILEFASLLGWNAVALRRYENGALLDLTHDRELQSAMTPEGFRKLVEINPSAIEQENRERILHILYSAEI